MSEEQVKETVQQEAVQAKPEPQIDIKSITDKVLGEVTKKTQELAETRAQELTSQKFNQLGRALLGEKDIDPDAELIKNIAKSPREVLYGLKEISKQEMRAEFQAQLQLDKTKDKISNKYLNEFPDLTSGRKLSLVENLAKAKLEEGESYKDALDSAFKEVVEEFGLKSIKEAQNNSAYGYGIPNGSFNAAQAKKDEADSQLDFIKGIQQQSLRTKKRIN